MTAEAERIRKTGHCDEHGRVDGMCAWMHEDDQTQAGNR